MSKFQYEHLVLFLKHKITSWFVMRYVRKCRG
jgi:hypothetical protein